MDQTSDQGPGLPDETSSSKARDVPIITRRWLFALFWAAIIISLGVLLSAIINPILGRSIHWDWMAGIVPVSFAIMAWALRRRWV